MRTSGVDCAQFWGCQPPRARGMPEMPVSLPLSLGGLGLRSAARNQIVCVLGKLGRHTSNGTEQKRPRIADEMVYQLEGMTQSPSLTAAKSAAAELDQFFDVPQWSALATGLRPPPRKPEQQEPGAPRQGWQHEAAACVERRFRETTLFPRMDPCERAMVRSQAGPNAWVALSTCPSSPLTRIDSPLFRVLLQRRLSLPFPLSKRICGCGLPNDIFGHHRAACSRTGMLGRRGFPLESAAARICREAGGRVATNLHVREMDLGVPIAADNSRRLEVVVDGLPLHGGVQLAIDTTLVSAVKGNGSPQPGAADRDGAALVSAHRRKMRTYPELVGPGARAPLVVLALEVGGRWSLEASNFVKLLAKARARSEPLVVQRRMEQARRLRWSAILACAAARSFAASLIGLRGGQGVDGQAPPSHEVECDFHNAGLCG